MPVVAEEMKQLGGEALSPRQHVHASLPSHDSLPTMPAKAQCPVDSLRTFGSCALTISASTASSGFIRRSRCRKMAERKGLTREQAALGMGGDADAARVGEPREVRYAVLFLASEESSFCTGSALFVTEDTPPSKHIPIVGKEMHDGLFGVSGSPDRAGRRTDLMQVASEIGDLPVIAAFRRASRGIDLGVGFAAEETGAGGERRGVRRLDDGVPARINKAEFLLRVAAPETIRPDSVFR